MKKRLRLGPISILCLTLVSPAWAALSPDWSEGALVPAAGRPNPYGLPEDVLPSAVERGRLHALQYPVTATEVLIPYRPIDGMLRSPFSLPLKAIFLTAIRWAGNLGSANDLFQWLGMQPYPLESDTGVYKVPYPGGKRPTYPMGATLTTRDGALGFTISCAACHAGSLFGKRVLGLTTRFPRANRLFHQARWLTQAVPAPLFQATLFTTSSERRLYSRARSALRYVDSKLPQALGLDTSLAHTALSLARRAPDELASKEPRFASRPDPEPLATEPSESKPAVWWNLKYKNRWLSDGSLVSGNPIYTNFLWNEIGRGVDLPKLESWLDANGKVVEELTAAVFATEAPRFTDFFPADQFDLEAAKRGQKLFENHCVRCHGSYRKAWEQTGSASLSAADRLKTVEVSYHESTPVFDVGTDPYRAKGMSSLAKRLNPLGLSRRKGILVVPQEGYVPPPLVGVWARWPYFHNNSAPSLCAVLTRGEERPKTYFAGEAIDPKTDFDSGCNGYPLADTTPAAWKRDGEKYFDSKKRGLGNGGHDEGIFLTNGQELLSPDQKLDVIRFLQTL